MNMHKTEQFLPHGDYNKYFSLLPPSFTTSGPALIVAVQSLVLKIGGSELFGMGEDRILLMGNAQTVNSGPCSIEEYLTQFPNLSEDDKDLVKNLITSRLQELESSINQS